MAKRERKRNFVAAVRQAVEEGRLREPFSPLDVQAACPGFAISTYATFLPKHSEDNPGGRRAYFDRVGRGRYALLRRDPSTSASGGSSGQAR
jgi:hypothetical protein